MKEEVSANSVDSDETVGRENITRVDVFSRSDLYMKQEEKPDIPKTEVPPVTENVVTAIKSEKLCSPKWEKCESDCEMDERLVARIREAVERGVSSHHSELLAAAKGTVGGIAKTEEEEEEDEDEDEEEEQFEGRGTVEIVDNEADVEIEGFSSPIADDMEPDAVLKQRVADMRLEFGGHIAEMARSERRSSAEDEEKRQCPPPSCSEASSKCVQETVQDDTSASFDEFDMEAQMKKITGDDGNDDDYQEKMMDTSSERDKSVDGIEGLMESSKEDSDFEEEDKEDVDDVERYCASESSSFKFDIHAEEDRHRVVGGEEEALFKEPKADTRPDSIVVSDDRVADDVSDAAKEEDVSERDVVADRGESPSEKKEICEEKTEEKPPPPPPSSASTTTTLVASSDDSIIESSVSPSAKTEDANDRRRADESPKMEEEEEEEVQQQQQPAAIFQSIPPLSERIRKKTTENATQKAAAKMDFEAAIIESTIDMESMEHESGTRNGEDSKLSSALRELLEARLDDDPPPSPSPPPPPPPPAEVMNTDNEINTVPTPMPAQQVTQPKSDSPAPSLDTAQESAVPQEAAGRRPDAASPAKEEEMKPIRRLKDPRTVVPNSMPAPPPFKPDLPPVKRKVRKNET